MEHLWTVPSSVAAKYIADSLYKKSKEKPADILKLTPSYKFSFYDDWTTLLRFIKLVYSNPFFIDHSTIRLSLLMLTSDSPLSVPLAPFPIH